MKFTPGRARFLGKSPRKVEFAGGGGGRISCDTSSSFQIRGSSLVFLFTLAALENHEILVTKFARFVKKIVVKKTDLLTEYLYKIYI